MIIFVSGTGTSVGKTYINIKLNALLMARGFEIISIKPIETGVEANSACGDFFSANVRNANILPQDALLHAQNQSTKKDIKDICFYTFSLPAAPFVADFQGEIDLDFLKRKIFALEKQCDILLIEGAGGLFVPITKDYFFIDLIKDLGRESSDLGDSCESKGESKSLESPESCEFPEFKSQKFHDSPESHKSLKSCDSRESHKLPESKAKSISHNPHKCLCALISDDKLGCIDLLLSHREALERRDIAFISIVNVFDKSQFLQISYPFLRHLERNFIFQTQEGEILDFIAKFINS